MERGWVKVYLWWNSLVLRFNGVQQLPVYRHGKPVVDDRTLNILGNSVSLQTELNVG